MLLRARHRILLAVLLAPAAALSAPKEKVIYSFTGGADGSAPSATLLNINGTLYGTASGLGETTGSVFAVTQAGIETTLATFDGGLDGYPPGSRLYKIGNTLYGTTFEGGTGCFGHGCGTVFSVPLSGGAITTLYTFQGGTDGAEPIDGLTTLYGDFFGVTYSGGNPACTFENGCGTVFKITPSGKKSIVHLFGSQGDGWNPSGRLIRHAGELYGVTANGGRFDYGTIFKISLDGTETVLYSFTGGSDGAYPSGALLEMNGALYGATPYVSVGTTPYNGSIFKFTTKLKTLYTFKGGSDGLGPNGDLLAIDGSLYGTTTYGGGAGCNNGCGTVFKLAANGKENILHAFSGPPDGNRPQGGLVKVNDLLYGVTYAGGTNTNLPVGTVFAVQP